MPALATETLAANGTDFASWRHCDVHTRSTFNIMSLCLSTLVICVWNAVHPDVPDPCAPRWGVYLKRLIAFLVGLFLPEVLVFTALIEFLEARQFLQEMNGAQSESMLTISYWKKILKGIYPRALTMLYWKEAWRPDVSAESTQPKWTMTQSFYATMGAFHAKSSSGRIGYLGSSEIKAVCEADSSKWAFFTANAIEDHSKAGALAKALFCWQLLVFAISCIARRAENLPLSLLEITTLAHSLCGLVTFGLWWHKPHSVDEVVVVPIEDSLEGKIRWREHLVTWNFITQPDYRIVSRVDVGDNHAKAVLTSMAVGGLYGLPHLLGLRIEFPTLAERRCWQVATAIIIGTPVFTVLFGWVNSSVVGNRLVDSILPLLLLGALVLYAIASCFIVAESFRQLFALPSGALVAPALVCYLPHFS